MTAADTRTAGPVRVAVDVMGGDLGPGELIRGVVESARARAEDVQLILVGDQAQIEAELSKHTPRPANIRVQHASQTIEMTDKPREVYRRKPDASVVVSARLVKQGDADAFISVGNTGAAMAAAVFLLRPLDGITRPAIATMLPSAQGVVVVLDAGATVDCTAAQLLEFGVMGEAYASHVLGIAHPRVGLLSNGEEPSKGNTLTRGAHQMLASQLPAFVGNVEGGDIFRGKADVIVCDGFDGNIVLKTCEGVAEMVMSLVKDALTRHSWMKVLLLPFRGELRRLRDRIDYREFGGAPLLGVRGVCIIGHGKSDSIAIFNAIRVAITSVTNRLVPEIERAATALNLKSATIPADPVTTPAETPVA